MLSEEGWSIARALLARYSDVPNEDDAAAVDAELQEIREVLHGLRGRYVKDCWCDAGDDAEHLSSCQRARALMSRLRVDGAPGEGKDG
jgi:hypothetical protein